MHNPAGTLAPCPYNASKEKAEIWGAMEEAHKEQPDKIRTIGVSNLDAHMLEELAKTQAVAPAINQVCYSVGDAEGMEPDIAYMCQHGITAQAYSPLHSCVPGTSISHLRQLKY
jgi:diketogulonate reductase-like aldo/keto reductase